MGVDFKLHISHKNIQEIKKGSPTLCHKVCLSENLLSYHSSGNDLKVDQRLLYIV